MVQDEFELDDDIERFIDTSQPKKRNIDPRQLDQTLNEKDKYLYPPTSQQLRATATP